MFRVIERQRGKQTGKVRHCMRSIFLRLSAAFARFARRAFRNPETPKAQVPRKVPR